MNVAAWILGVFLAVIFGGAGVMKVLDMDRLRDHLGYGKRTYQLIGLCEIGAAAGVIAGVAWPKIEWLGVAAGVGIVSLMVGALMAHAKVEDETKKIVPALVLLALAIVFMVVVSLR